MPGNKPDGRYFHLELRPNRSLPPRQFFLMIAGVGLIFLLMGVRFLFLGAWPILPFMLADLALLWWAMRASYRSGEAREEVRLSDAGLELVRIAPAGGRRAVRLEPVWTRVELERLGARQNRLWLKSGAQREPVGTFLSPGERADVAQVISDGLARYRSGLGERQ